jgi:hypothetical protein
MWSATTISCEQDCERLEFKSTESSLIEVGITHDVCHDLCDWPYSHVLVVVTSWEWRIFDVGGCRTLVSTGDIRDHSITDFRLSVQHGYLISRTLMSSFSVSFCTHGIAMETHTHQVTPVSVFDETLWEDPGVNRLQDSTELWTSICCSDLLAKSQLIHFLNKCDLLHRKLKRGISFKKYLKSYGERPNDVTSAVKC